jgi:hypothetical protein
MQLFWASSELFIERKSERTFRIFVNFGASDALSVGMTRREHRCDQPAART